MGGRPSGQRQATDVALALVSNGETSNKESQTMEEVYADIQGEDLMKNAAIELEYHLDQFYGNDNVVVNANFNNSGGGTTPSPLGSPAIQAEKPEVQAVRPVQYPP